MAGLDTLVPENTVMSLPPPWGAPVAPGGACRRALGRLVRPALGRLAGLDEGHRTDRPLDHVGVDLEPAIVEEDGEARPQFESLADRLGGA